jgi:hypothetical protein
LIGLPPVLAVPKINQALGCCVAAALVLGASSGARACAVERRLVRVAADQNAVLIAEFARPAGIAELAAIAAPSAPAARPSARFAPAELTLYTLSGTLLAIDRTAAGDDRLVIADFDQPQIAIVAVAADPACAAGSWFADNIAALRNAIQRKFGTFSRVTPNLPVTVTGVAFFAGGPRPAGTAANGLELQPLIGIAF